MLRSGPDQYRTYTFYMPHSRSINSILDEATRQFGLYKESKDHAALAHSLQKFGEALALAERVHKLQADDNTCADLAYVHRRRASAIIRDKKNPTRYQTAKRDLTHALSLYEGMPQPLGRKLQLEYKRTLAQLIKVSYELKNGVMLHRAAAELYELTNSSSDSTFRYDALQALYTSNYAMGKLTEAKSFVEQALALVGTHSSFSSATNLKHLSKIHLSMLLKGSIDRDKQEYFKSQVLRPFWECFDQHKTEFKTNPSFNQKMSMIKDLKLLFALRLAEVVIFGERGVVFPGSKAETPIEYVMRQARKLFRNEDTLQQLENNLNELAQSIYETGTYPLSHNYFTDTDRPKISVSDEHFQILFPDYRPEHRTGPRSH